MNLNIHVLHEFLFSLRILLIRMEQNDELDKNLSNLSFTNGHY